MPQYPICQMGVIILTYLTGVLWGIINPSWSNTIGSSMEDILSLKGFSPHLVVPRLELLCDLGKFFAPHPSSKLLVQMLTVFSWLLEPQSCRLIRMLWREALNLFCICIHQEVVSEPRILDWGIMWWGCYCFFLCASRKGRFPWNKTNPLGLTVLHITPHTGPRTAG